MAILPISAEQQLKKEIQANPQAGPKPISIEDYRRRLQLKKESKELRQDKPTPPPPVQQQKKRGGFKVKIRKEIAECHRLAAISVTREEKKKFINQIKALERKRQRWDGFRQTERKISSFLQTTPDHHLQLKKGPFLTPK